MTDLTKPAPICKVCGESVLSHFDKFHPFVPTIVTDFAAHDVPAAQLRERLAEAERELATLRAEIDDSKLCKDGLWYCAPAEKLAQERDTARADCKLHMESFLTVANAMGMPEAHPQKIANEIAALRAEAADLRARLAALHPLADMAAGLLAEKVNADDAFQLLMDEALKHRRVWPTMKSRSKAEDEAFKRGYEAARQQAIEQAHAGRNLDLIGGSTGNAWGTANQIAAAIRDMQPEAQRPEAEGREG